MQLRADEAAVVEKAVRLAIESVMNVLCAVNSARTNELQRKVTDREQEIRRLEDRVRETEGELRLLRRWWSPGRAPEQSSGAEPDRESSAEQRECQVRVSLALLTGPPSQDPPDGMELDQTCSSKDRNVPQLPACPPEGHVQPAPLGPPEGHVQPAPLGPPEGHIQPAPLCPPEGHVQPAPLCPPEGHVQPPSRCPPEEHIQQEPNCPSDGPGPQESHCAINKQVKLEPHYPSPAQIKQEPFCPDYGHIQVEDIPAVFLQRDLNEDMSNRVEDILGHCELWQNASLEAEDAPHLWPRVCPTHWGCPESKDVPLQEGAV
ncbi:uncharacterized protein [Eucyclogobius newberryi]|uniref:uncharacterized protein isoform X2 n=1 Tax=Eucyclogobius newberryi TaxID=166745 RepID=UPI003B597262